MNAIVGLIELCLQGDMQDKQRQYLERIEAASQSLMSIINDILDVSKMEAGKMQLDSVAFQLEDTLSGVYAMMNELSRRKKIPLVIFEHGAPYPTVVGDPQRLQQVLINLLGNAIKFTHKGQVKIEIKELQRDRVSSCFEFSISDTGIGISQANLSKLFQPFSQGDSSVTRHYGGTGLGLTISKKLVEAMGGEIRVASREGIGSTFSFVITLPHAKRSETAVSNEVKTPEPLPDYIRNARVLLVEDNEINRMVIVEILQQAGIRVEMAEHGQNALPLLAQNQYDCILMDVQMPVMDGYQTTQHIRQMPAYRQVPIIAITANALTENRNKCLAVGMNDFLSKPVRSSSLYEILRKWIKPVANA